MTPNGALKTGSLGPAIEAAKGCTPDTRRCQEARDASIATPDCCRRWNVKVLRDVAAALDDLGVRWWIDYGMLLGYMTNGGFYWNDKDTDVSALTDDRQLILSITPALQRAGYNPRYFAPQPHDYWQWGDVLKIFLSRKNKTNCDITFWHRRDDGILDRVSYGYGDQFKGREMPESWVFPTTRGIWEGIAVNVPAEPEKLVAHRYGEDWRNLPAAKHASVPV